MTNDPDGPDRVELADAPTRQARNSATFWAATGSSRGDEVVRQRAYVAVVGSARTGSRVLIQEPDLTASECAEVLDLVRGASGPMTVEDPFSALDLGELDLRSWQMPVMVRQVSPAVAPAMDVVRVGDDTDLQAAERIVIDSFDLTSFEPYRAGELFPPALLEQPGVDVYVATVEGQPVGACVAVVADGLGSHYWVGTPSASRSRGAGRAVMAASLVDMGGLPATLTASRLGRPLYESLGYELASPSTWWASR
ncbi:hypothetical protein VV02_02810 [Luteipulveratus mongoliensis]|uniref:N-acetyltransferase domain-containing protein n=2 Tax=Luteipulveratus mongoliensis TaxID=571913 RepID=A0A0K1JEA7_9MICO|nr:hypothetical protein VV02_02810 [Luteipulveratus mongoliensis]